MTSRPGASREDEIGKWSEEKLKLLADYLHAYSVIMNGQKSKWLKAYHYIDAFAGSVRHKPKESKRSTETYISGEPLWALEEALPSLEITQDVERYIEGSPLRALQTVPPFDACWFMELSSWRLDQLEALRSQFPGRDIRVRRGDCNYILRQEVIPAITKATSQRGVVFLDPYGLQIEWQTVKTLAAAGTFDIFVNFSLMHVTRLLKRRELPNEQVVEQLSRMMGSAEWVHELYKAPQHEPSQQMMLWEDQPEDHSAVRDVITAEGLANIYLAQVSQLFKFVSRPVIMRNSRNSALYALFLASHNSTGVKIMNDIFDKYERLKKH